MPFNKERVAATYAKEILRVWTGNEIAENAVVDGFSVPLNADNRRILESGQVMVYAGLDEEQQVTVTGATGGTFTLTFGANTTAGIPYNATAAQVDAALELIASVGAGNVAVEGAAGGPWRIRFVGTLAAANQAAMTASGAGLTGTAPAVAVTTLVNGAAPAAGASQQVKPAPASGVAAAAVAGILMATTEFWPEPAVEFDKDDKPVALFTKNCSFSIPMLVSYSGNAAAVKTAMTGAGNDHCANCTFES